jgi:hypothetical protein
VNPFVSEEAIDYEEIYRRGGTNYGDEDFAFFKCPHCGYVYLLEYEVGTVYLNPNDLSCRVPVHSETLSCVQCGQEVPSDGAWVGPAVKPGFSVTWEELAASGWAWAARRPTG